MCAPLPDQQGEYKICFSVINQPAPHDVEVDFDLKVGYEASDLNLRLVL